MLLDCFSINRHSYRMGEFPSHHTHVLKVVQTNGYQLFTGVSHDLTLLSSYFIHLISVRSVKIYAIDDYE